MSFTAFCCGCNVVAYNKNGKKFGMTCAWAQMVDYDKVTMLLGSQSDTGKNIEVGDIIGVSSLASDQESICNNFGDGHSLLKNKFDGIDYREDESAILINGARVNMKCRVIDIIELKGDTDDKFIYLEIVNSVENTDKEFLVFKM